MGKDDSIPFFFKSQNVFYEIKRGNGHRRIFSKTGKEARKDGEGRGFYFY